MDLFTLIILLVIFVVILLFAKWVTTLRTIVPMNSADVVINGTGSNIYSGDPKVSPTGTPNAVYYAIPQWIPRYGVTAKRMPLSIIDIAIEDFVTFAKGNPRFVVDVSVYCKIVDVAEAARRFPDTPLPSVMDVSSSDEIWISCLSATMNCPIISDLWAQCPENWTAIRR